MAIQTELPPVFFIGARACGKSTVGALAAKLLNMRFMDTDQRVRDDDGRETEDIVASGGWAEFRALESAALRDCTASNTVIATGGGIVLDPRNRAFMRANGLVIFLEAPAAALSARLLERPEPRLRPSLTGLPVHEEAARIAAEREPFYRAAAHYAVAASHTASEVAREAADIIMREAAKRQEAELSPAECRREP